MDFLFSFFVSIVLISLSVGIIFQFRIDLKERRKLLSVFLFSLLVFLFTVLDSDQYFVGEDLFIFVLSFLFIFSIEFRDRVFLKMNEGQLLLWNMIFGYLVFVHFPQIVHFPVILIFLIALFIMVLFVNLTSFVLHASMKLFLYVWYLCIMGFILIQHLVVFSSYWDPTILTFDGFLIGQFIDLLFFVLSSFYLVAYYMHLILLVPIPGRNESFQVMKKRVWEQSRFFISLYEDHQSSPFVVLLFLLVTGGILFGNFHYQWIESHLFISLIILFGPPLTRFIISPRRS